MRLHDQNHHCKQSQTEDCGSAYFSYNHRFMPLKLRPNNLIPLLLFISAGILAAEKVPFSVEEVSITSLEAAYLAGHTTVHEIVQAHLDRIAAYDKRGPLINSPITINPDALEEADRLDAALKATGKLVGALHGIPVIVKDNIDVAGLPMTSVFQGWKNYYPPSDAP
jgi:amidase